ncbi:MAG: DUF4336 domain-containing protein [Ferrovum sp.]|jgi:hypothetical protein|uniref:DUF4336 domain-containing protein n=1 Tax=Ferrovum sp. TaxID=2609467 RepID=UPI0026283CA3|nr:DUF4336 domain-containing protein [Ferrovum sp.]MBW8068284.1 DUF4336 domain-containing protein [Ferrovum sp.]
MTNPNHSLEASFPERSDAAPLRPFGDDLWICEGPVVPFLGFPYPTRMALIRLPDGALLVWSPISLSTALRDAVDAIGPVRYLVSPNQLHHLFLAQWKSAYPSAGLFAPPGLRKKRRDLRFDADLDSTPRAEWAAEVDQVAMVGSVAMTEIVFFHRRSRTAIFGDLIQNFPADWFRGWRGMLARLDGIVAPHPGAPREWRLSFVHRKAARLALQKVLAWPIERVIVAHGDVVPRDGADFVRRAFSWLSIP